MTAKEAAQYRGSIVINTEEELFYPSLTVGKTMDFATRLNIPNALPNDAESREDYRIKFKNFLLDSMGIAHTEDTKVGDAFVRGVSGGERKRVSIIETLCTRGSVMAWDNSVSQESQHVTAPTKPSLDSRIGRFHSSRIHPCPALYDRYYGHRHDCDLVSGRKRYLRSI